MSVIVFSGGVMAADTGGYRGDFIVSRTVKKIARTSSGCLVGACGSWRVVDEFKKWAEAGFPVGNGPQPVEKSEEFGGIVAFPDGTVLSYNHQMLAEDCSGESYVFEGVGDEFCLALSTLGWSPERIVAHAIEHCVWAAGEVLVLRLEDAPEQPSEVESDEDEAEEPTLWVDGEEPQETRAFLRDRGLGGPL